MKTFKLKNTLIIASLMILSCVGTALPSEAAIPYTTPDTGYWVVESNQLTRDYTVIRFYDSQHRLLYEENLEGVYLNIKKRRHVKMLNKTLSLVQSNRLVAGQLKNYKQHIASSLATKK